MYVSGCSVTKSCLTPDPIQAPLSLGFSEQEYRSGLPFPPPGDLASPGIEPTFSALAGWILYQWATREAQYTCNISEHRASYRLLLLHECPEPEFPDSVQGPPGELQNTMSFETLLHKVFWGWEGVSGLLRKHRRLLSTLGRVSLHSPCPPFTFSLAVWNEDERPAWRRALAAGCRRGSPEAAATVRDRGGMSQLLAEPSSEVTAACCLQTHILCQALSAQTRAETHTHPSGKGWGVLPELEGMPLLLKRHELHREHIWFKFRLKASALHRLTSH